MRDERHVIAGDILKYLRGAVIAQRQHRGELEARIDLALDALNFAPLLQGCEKAAKALVQDPSSRPACKRFRSCAALPVRLPVRNRSCQPARSRSHTPH